DRAREKGGKMIPAANFVPVEWLQLLAESTLKGSLLLLLGGVATLALYRSSAAVRHAVWTSATAGVLLIAPLALLLPAIHVRPPVALAGALARFSQGESASRNVQPVDTPDMAEFRTAFSGSDPARRLGFGSVDSVVLFPRRRRATQPDRAPVQFRGGTLHRSTGPLDRSTTGCCLDARAAAMDRS